MTEPSLLEHRATAPEEIDSPLRRTAPLLDSYLAYFEGDRTPFTIPGHKQRASRLDHGLGVVVDSDSPLYGGLDEIKQTNGTLREAERLAAKLWGADYGRFSTGGSTHANQAAILALGKPGDRILLPRTSHRSVLSAIVLAGLEPVWLSPSIDPATGIPTGVPLSELHRVLRSEGTAAPEDAAVRCAPIIALLLTEPGYLGTLSDLRALVSVAHAAGLPVVVDAAWGGHFGFAPGILPEHCLQAGADVLITSVHKALPGYSAAALLLARAGRVSFARIDQAFEALHTTSPAGAPLASIDGVRALLAARGPALLQGLVERVATLKASVEEAVLGPCRCRRLFLDAADFPPGRFDPAKLVLRVGQLGQQAASGVAIERSLAAHKHRIRVEMADTDTVVFMATLADGPAEFARLSAALVAVLRPLVAPEPRPPVTAISWAVRPPPPQSRASGVPMRAAFFSATELVPAAEAEGRLSADLIAPYPPGVAVVAPGEVLTADIIAGLRAARASGVRVAYATDPTLATFRVVALAAVSTASARGGGT
jgi:arginine decarboxylase